MQYDAKNAEDYLDTLEEDWRKDKLLAVRKMILDYAPEFEEAIRYKMLNFGKDDDYIFALNAQKHYVSHYVGTIKKVEQAEELLKSFNQGKECIRIKKSNHLAETGLEAFIHKTVDMWREGEDEEDTAC